MRADLNLSPDLPGHLRPRTAPPDVLGLVRRAKKVGTVDALPGSALLNFKAWKGAPQPLNPGIIPEKLKDLPQWVGYRKVKVNGRLTKVPFQTESPGKKASSTNPRTWGTFEQAVAASRTYGFDGIGYVFSPDDPFCGIDIDHGLVAGKLRYCAKILIDHGNSYSEVSPSGKGIHTLVEAKWPENAGHKKILPCGMEIEVYDSARYFTVTAHHLPGTPTTIEDRQAELEALHAQVFAKPGPNLAAASNPSLTPAPDSGNGGGAAVTIHDADLLPPEEDHAVLLTDDELIEKARRGKHGAKFARLWGGDITAHDGPDRSHNAADLALCSMLAWYTGPDPARIGSLFRRSGLCQAPERIKKWNRQDYRDRTISKALEGKTEFYNPAKAKARAKAKADKISADADLASVQGLSKELNISMKKIKRLSGEPVKTVIEFEDGRSAKFTTKELLQQRTFRTKIVDACEQLPRKFAPEDWEAIFIAIVQAAEKQDVGIEGTQAGVIQEYLIAYLEFNPPEPSWEGFDGEVPVKEDGKIFIPLRPFKKYLNMQFTRLTDTELAHTLHLLGAVNVSKKRDGRTWRLWELPPSIQIREKKGLHQGLHRRNLATY